MADEITGAGQPLVPQRAGGHVPTHVLLAGQLVLRDADVIEKRLVEFGAARNLLQAANGDPA